MHDKAHGTSDGTHMPNTWLNAWQNDGNNMTHAWQLYGKHMETPWQIHGNGTIRRPFAVVSAGVLAPSQDNIPVRAFCLATYNIGAQNPDSFAGKLKSGFEQWFGRDLEKMMKVADIWCVQEISGECAEFMQRKTQWQMLWQDKKAFCWRPGVKMTFHEWKRVFPEPDAGERRRHRGVHWVAHCSGISCGGC